MVQKEYTEEDIENIKKTAELLKEMNTRFCTGHCTGELAYCWMKEIMGERLFEIKIYRLKSSGLIQIQSP